MMSWIPKLWVWLVARRVLVRTRRQLRHLSEKQLEDIGVSKSEALEESGKPFWRS